MILALGKKFDVEQSMNLSEQREWKCSVQEWYCCVSCNYFSILYAHLIFS